MPGVAGPAPGQLRVHSSQEESDHEGYQHAPVSVCEWPLH